MTKSNFKFIFGSLLTLCLLAMLVLVLLTLMVRVAVVDASEPEEISLSMAAGETYVIDNLKEGASPSIKVLENPHAMYTNTEAPGKLIIVAAETGRWAIGVKRADGVEVTYDVKVKGLKNWADQLKPGVSPPAITDAGLRAATAAPMTSTPGDSAPERLMASTSTPPAPLDAGAGPLAPAAPPAMAAPAVMGASALPPRAAASGSSDYEPVRSEGIPDLVIPHQETGSLETRSGQFHSDPPVAPGGYLSDSVSGTRNYLPSDAISLMIGTSRVFDFHRRLTRVSVADSKIADVQVVNPFQLNLIGHMPGFTTLALWDDLGNYDERQVRVDPNGRQQVMINCIVAELNRTNLENQGLNYVFSLPKYNVTLVGLPGAVGTPFTQQTSTSGAAVPSTVLPLGGQLLPLLLSSNMTYGLAAQNSNIFTQTLFQYLEQHNLGRILAEPHLLANSGERAKFLSGGEIPIVIAQALNTSIVFKQFGTSVEFLPTVIGNDDIEMLVKPELSEPDYSHGVMEFGFSIPAFVTRRAETLVQLKDNQTLIIAGLIQHEKTAQVLKVPYLGDLPYAGALFRNTYWTDSESDLVMSVTPQIVAALPPGGQVFLPSNRGPLSSAEIRTRTLNPPDASRPRF
ncbi:MAG TPA: pilus assembly protein N-terminal domain-containing protein [Candidatus Binataceae bacterium]